MIVRLDFETRSLVDLPLEGAYKYAIHPSTDVLCACWALDDGPVEIWTMGAAPPVALLELARSPMALFGAFNVGFERRIWEHILHRRYGWPMIPLERWHDSQADALAMGFPGHLKGCAKALGVDEQKDDAGTRLINLLSKPIKGTTKFRSKEDFPLYYQQLYDYCRQDVMTEREVAKALEATTLEGQEREVWMMTEEMNDAGVPVDYETAAAFWSLVDVELKDRACETLIHLTNGDVKSGTEVAKMNGSLDDTLPDFTAATIRAHLDDPLVSDRDKEIMRARQVFSNTSTAKFKRMVAMADRHNIVRDILQYHGAATGRYAGRGIQIQNFPRSSAKNADEIARYLLLPETTLDAFEERFGPVQDVAKTMLRPTLCAPRGHIFVCYDYSSIEARGTAWTTNDENQLESFRAGRDIYRVTASDMYGVPYEEVSKDSMERQAGKIAVLACGYQGGWRALKDFAIGYGVFWTPKESYKIVQNFRTARPKLVNAWSAFDDAAQAAIRDPGHYYEVEGCRYASFRMYGRHLAMELPNGKRIWFPYAEIRFIKVKYLTHEGKIRIMERFSVTHMWVNNNIWVRRSIHGGSLFQSYVQAICREIMVEAMLRLRKAGWPLNMTVHDEIASVVPESWERRADEYRQIMVEVPSWARGFPIDASGWTGRRYRK